MASNIWTADAPACSAWPLKPWQQSDSGGYITKKYLLHCEQPLGKACAVLLLLNFFKGVDEKKGGVMSDQHSS